MQIGAFTFADVSVTGGVGPVQRIPELLEEITLADQVGLDVFGLGEHHHPGFAAPSPPVILAAAAGRTSRIRLTSAVTVLSSDDPVRVFEQFTALDLASQGRAEVMVGRGALLDSFRLFGHDLQHYDELFDEKLRLLLDLRTGEPVTWSGRFRAPLSAEVVLPRPVQDPLPVSVAVGGSPSSVVRAAALGLPMTIGTVGGLAAQFGPLAELYREALAQYGHGPQPLAVTLHGFVADTSQKAAEVLLPRRCGPAAEHEPARRHSVHAGRAVTGSEALRAVGVIGAGKSGTAIARQALNAGYDVRIATSGPAARTALITGILTPGATPVSVARLVEESDLIVLAVPLRGFRELPLDTLASRLVVDAMNYWPPSTASCPSSRARPTPRAWWCAARFRPRPGWSRRSTTSGTTRSRSWPGPLAPRAAWRWASQATRQRPSAPSRAWWTPSALIRSTWGKRCSAARIARLRC